MTEQNDNAKRAWATLITNLDYLPGLLTLTYSLKRVDSKYALVALYTDTLPPAGLAALDARNIKKHWVPSLQPLSDRRYDGDPRFNDTWTKLIAFSLVEYERIVLLDSDMLARQNMDELMELELDPRVLKGNGQKVFAASHACCCNPLKKPHYPRDWKPSNCAFTLQHYEPDKAQVEGAPPTAGIAMLNSGLLVINPSPVIFAKIQRAMNTPSLVEKYDFPDQSLLSDVFAGQWFPLPYVYNALKTLRWEEVHSQIWRDDNVKNVHYIFATKPWHEKSNHSTDETHRWWWSANQDRQRVERQAGIKDSW